MGQQPSVALAAYLIADPARAAMLTTLLDGRARPAGELARAAGITAQTASSHLGKLLVGELLLVETQGRHRYYRLAGPRVAAALEGLAAIGPVEPLRGRPSTPEVQRLRFARCCYDHLAGRVGVAVTRGLRDRGFLVPTACNQFEVTPAGLAWFSELGIDVGKVGRSRRGLARQCLDWTERDYHLAGPLGVRLTSLFCDDGWIRRMKSSRTVEVTPKGWALFKQHLGISQQTIPM